MNLRLIRRVDYCERVPRGFGVFWRDVARRQVVVAPFPFHLVLWFLREAYYFFAFPPLMITEREKLEAQVKVLEEDIKGCGKTTDALLEGKSGLAARVYDLEKENKRLRLRIQELESSEAHKRQVAINKSLDEWVKSLPKQSRRGSIHGD